MKFGKFNITNMIKAGTILIFALMLNIAGLNNSNAQGYNPRPVTTMGAYAPTAREAVERSTEKIEFVEIQNLQDNSVQKIQTDGVFIFVGMIPQTELFENLKKDEQGYILTDKKMQTSQKGIFCAGDVRSKPFRQIVTATSDGAIASHSASEYIKELNNEVYL